MKKSFFAIALVSALLMLLLGYRGSSEQLTTSKPPPVQEAAIAQGVERGSIARSNNSPQFQQPIACVLGKDCFILHYPDRDPGPEIVDFNCGRLTYDGHDGTDFAIPDEGVMAAGVAVKAAAAGKVLRVRDSVPDRRVESPADRAKVKGIECGNGVAIDHGNGWQTQYCHLRQGSIVVSSGTSVAAGTVLGMVGESGDASFPHVHLTVRYQNNKVDPFVGPNAGPGCRVARHPIWAKPIAYVPTGLVRAGFADDIPQMADIWQGRFKQTKLQRNASAVVFWIQVYGVEKGDEEQLRLFAPDGRLTLDQKQKLKSSNRVWLGYVGKKASSNQPLKPGVWRGEYILHRGAKVLISLKREVLIDD